MRTIKIDTMYGNFDLVYAEEHTLHDLYCAIRLAAKDFIVPAMDIKIKYRNYALPDSPVLCKDYHIDSPALFGLQPFANVRRLIVTGLTEAFVNQRIHKPLVVADYDNRAIPMDCSP